MVFGWIENNKTLIEVIEGGSINEIIEYSYPYHSENTYSFDVLASSIPSDITIRKNDEIVDEKNEIVIGYFSINCEELPVVYNDGIYHIIFRALETNNKKIVDIKDFCVELVIKNKKIQWKDENTKVYNITEYTDIDYNLINDLLINIDGNETIKKISGELPDGLKITDDGRLIGSFMKESGNDNTYVIFVRPFINDEPIESIKEKELVFEIQPPKLESKPEWITNEGRIGSIKYGETSTISVLAYDPSNNFDVTYRIVGGQIPYGLSFDEKTGQFYGKLKTNHRNIWDIVITAIKIYNNEEIISDERVFKIETNNISSINEIVWEETEDLIGSYMIGENITFQIPKASTKDGLNISYKIIGGNLPKGLILNKNGLISGQVQYQEYNKDYSFDVCAKTNITSSIKTFKIHVKKGLGNNSLKLYLRFNNEYRQQINSIRNNFNDKIFDNGSINFDIDMFPKIDIATLTCYDREILSYMMDFGNPEVVRLGETKKIQYSQPDKDGNIIHKYDLFYKSIDESTLQWEKMDNGNFDFQKVVDEWNKDNIDTEEIEFIEFNNEKYDSHKNTIWSYTEPTENENEEELFIKNYETDPHVKYPVFNFEHVRNILSQKIYVYKKTDGYYYYDKGSHEILGKSLGIDDRTFNPEYNHMEVIDDTDGNLTVKNAEVIDDTDGNLILKDTFEYGENIYNPWCFDRNKNSIKITKLKDDIEMVMPLINDEDIMYEINENGEEVAYVKFLNEELEPLPEWKNEEIKEWSPNTIYKIGDIIKYNYKYYKCKQEFTSGESYIYDSNLYDLLTDTTIKDNLVKKYFPTLDIGYYDIDTNTSNLKKLNEMEKNGEYLSRYDFVFYEVTGEHLFKTEVSSEPLLIEEDYNKSKQQEIKNHDSLLGIPFMPLSYVDYGHSPLMKTISINVTPNDAHIYLSPLSDPDVHNSSTLSYGTPIEYKISKPKYYGLEDKFKLLMDEEIDIKLKKKIKFILKTLPYVEEITLKTKDNTEYFDYIENGIVVGKYIMVKEDDVIFYSVNNKDYVKIDNHIVASSNTEMDDYFEQTLVLSLTPLYTITIEPSPSDANVLLICDDYEQVDNSITVPKDSYIYFTVSKNGYHTINGRHRAIKNETIPVYLNEHQCLLVVYAYPHDSEIILTADGYEQVGNSISVLSGTNVSVTIKKAGYYEYNDIVYVSENKILNVVLEQKMIDISVVPTPHDSTVVLTADGYEQVGNSITVPIDTEVSISVSKENYESYNETRIFNKSEILNINLSKDKVTLVVVPTPNDATVVLTANGYEQVGNSITVPHGTNVIINVSKENYISKEINLLVDKNMVYNVSLESQMVTLTVEPTPSNAEVKLLCNGYEQVGNSITVPINSYVNYIVSKYGYNTKSGTHKVTRTQTLLVDLTNNVYTITVIPTPSNANVVLTSNHSVGQQIDNSICVLSDTFEEKTWVNYNVSLERYKPVEQTLNSITNNTTIEVMLRKICNVQFEIIPEDAILKINNETIYDRSLTVLSGDKLTYTVTRVGYDDVYGEKTILDDTIIRINMNDKHYFVKEEDDKQYFINEITGEPFTRE